jgi:hypothetical protein
VTTDTLEKIISIEAEIRNRVNYIVRKIGEMEGKCVNDWEWEFLEGDTLAAIEEILDDDTVCRYDDDVWISVNMWGGFAGGQNVLFLEPGDEEPLSISDYFPARWLWEDFEEELEAGVKRYKDSIAKEEEEVARKKDEEKGRVKEIRKKLTKDEINLIRKVGI